MPVQPTYPGVYIEEIPSSVHSITGVPTSITAFVGTAEKGPDSTDPVMPAIAVGSPLQYERIFGRMDRSPLGIAVKLFFLNGGSQALIVRVTPDKLGYATVDLKSTGRDAGPRLQATSRGAWGANLVARVDYDCPDGGKTTYNLTLRERAPGGRSERYTVSTDRTSPRTLERLLKSSSLVTLADGSPNPLGMPAAHDNVARRGDDPFAEASAQPPTPTPSPGPAPTPLTPPTSPSGDGTPGTTPPPSPPPRPTPTPAARGMYELFVLSGSATPAGDPEPSDDDYAPSSMDSGIYALLGHNLFFNMLVLVGPNGGDLSRSTLTEAAKIAFDKRAFMIVDAAQGWTSTDLALQGRDTLVDPLGELGRRNSALYYPRLVLEELSHTASPSIDVTSFPAAGAIAGLYARTDVERGVWKAPAGLTTGIAGAIGLTQVLTDFDSGRLNPVAINALRTLPIVGNVIWGARTLVGSDLEADQWKYIPVRRLALFIEESLYRGTQWVVFEPND